MAIYLIFYSTSHSFYKLNTIHGFNVCRIYSILVDDDEFPLENAKQ